MQWITRGLRISCPGGWGVIFRASHIDEGKGWAGTWVNERHQWVWVCLVDTSTTVNGGCGRKPHPHLLCVCITPHNCVNNASSRISLISNRPYISVTYFLLAENLQPCRFMKEIPFLQLRESRGILSATTYVVSWLIRHSRYIRSLVGRDSAVGQLVARVSPAVGYLIT